MAECLVPDLPAVKLALEQINELDKQLRAERAPFSQEASNDLIQIAQAIKDLEASRRAARDQLEVQTIETSKLRHQDRTQRDDIIREISAAAAAARDAGAAELKQLRQELSDVEQEIQVMEKRQELLEDQNALLLPERDVLKAQHDELVSQLNQQLSEKADLQIHVTDTKKEIRSTKDKIEHSAAAKERLEEEMIHHRRTFSERKNLLEDEMKTMENSIQDQRRMNAEKRRELDEVTAQLVEREDRVHEYSQQVVQLEGSVAELSSTRQNLEAQLEAETRRSERLDEQRAAQETELQELEEARKQNVLTLQENIAQVEGEIEAAQKLNGVHVRSLAEISEIFREQRRTEDEAMAEHHSLMGRLQKSKQQLDERVAAVATYKLENKEMQAEMKQLHESNKVNAELFQKKLKDLEEKLLNAKKSRTKLETHRDEQRDSLETLKEQQERSANELGSAVAVTESRYSELRGEEKKLQEEDEATDALIEELTREISRAQEENQKMKMKYQEEIKQLMLDAESITQAQQEKENQFKERRSVLVEVEAQWERERSRYKILQEHTTELQNRRDDLEFSIQQMKDQTAALLKSKEDVQKELQTVGEKHVETLAWLSEQIYVTERKLYETGRTLERVNVENSRLHLSVELMEEEMSDVNMEKRKHTQEIEQMKEEVQSLCSTLLEDWMVNKVATEEASARDQQLVEEMQALLLQVNKRTHHVGDVNSRLERELRGVSERLEKVSFQQQQQKDERNPV
ncbi:cingulin [Trichomycterus rosablanca]|uniref:cingulin n=1 Tax=Trichomycterus rosablanca TaxID=2290929 RepID=UPI002F35B908